MVGACLLAGLEVPGHRVRALSPMTPEALRDGDAFALAHPRVAVVRYLMPPAREPMLHDEDFRRREGEQIAATLPRLIAHERPDLILVGHENLAWHVPALARAHGLPCVLLVHGSAALVALTAPRSPLVGREQLLTELGRVDPIITVARHLADRLTEQGFTKIRMIPNMVDLEQFAPRSRLEPLRGALGLRGHDLVVAHVSGLTALKRPLDIVASAELALRENPRLVHVIVGDGPMREAMEDACRRAGLLERFRFVGWVGHRRVAEYLSLADLVVMPSESEGQALVYLETQACGRLVLASDIPGAREVIVDGETGLLFRKGDIANLAAKTLLAAGDESLREAIGRNARKVVEAHRLEAVVARYEAALVEAVQQHARRAPPG